MTSYIEEYGNKFSIRQTDVDLYARDVNVIPAAYHASPFGGIRVAADFVAQDNVHFYPGVATAYDTDKYGYEAASGGTITHVAGQSALKLEVVDGTNGAKARLRTHDQVRYQAGAATHIKLTGYASETGTLYSVVRSSTSGSVVDTRTALTGWSEDATTSVSVTNGNIYEIMYQWLGVGDCFYFVNGRLRHIERHAGLLTTPYMKTATLPISVEVVNSSGTQYIRFGQFDDSDGVFYEIQRTAAAGAFTYICSSARILNGQNYPTTGFGYSAAASGVSTTIIPLFSMRIKATLNGITSRVQALPSRLSFFAESQPGACVLIINPTLTGASWAATSPSPAIEIDSAASALSNGTTMLRVGLGGSESQTYPLDDLFTIEGLKLRRQAFTGTADILTVGVVREGAVNFDPRVTLNWKEIR